MKRCGISTFPRRCVAAFAVPLALLALSGCGDDEPGGQVTNEPGAGPDDLTPPGTTLELGQTATVPRTDGTAVIELTVTEIEQGTSADLRSVGYDDADQDTPHYVRYEMRLVSGEPGGITMRHYLSAWSGDAQASELVLSERFSRCQERNFPIDAGPGTTITSCRPYVTDKGAAPVDSVQFDNEDAYQGVEGTSITWR